MFRNRTFKVLSNLILLVVFCTGHAAAAPGNNRNYLNDSNEINSNVSSSKSILSEFNNHILRTDQSSMNTESIPSFKSSQIGESSGGTIDWNTFLGWPEYDDSNIALFNNNYIYKIGSSYSSWGNPLYPFSGGDDISIVKFTTDGDLLWNTFLGSANNDHGNGIVIDSLGNIYVTGSSNANWGNPINPYAGVGSDDAFVAKLDSNGNLLWNTFLGSNQSDKSNDVILDEIGNIYIAGSSNGAWGMPIAPYSSSDFNYSDAFAAKLDANGNLLWNTFLGSWQGDYASHITQDNNGNSYITGSSSLSWSSPINLFSSEMTQFVAKIDASGNLVWNTFLGAATDIGIDSNNNLYVAGNSSISWGAPLNNISGEMDISVAKLDNGGTLLWNTFIGSPSHERNRGMFVTKEGNIYLTGESSGTWGSPINPHLDELYPDAYLVKIKTNGEMAWNTFFGGYIADYGDGIALDDNSNIYITGFSTNTWGWPINGHGFGADDTFVAKIADVPPPSLTISGNWQFLDKNGAIQDISSVYYEAFDSDPEGVDDLLCSGNGGSFSCTVLNVDEDGTNLDPYVVIYSEETKVPNVGVKVLKVGESMSSDCNGGTDIGVYSEKSDVTNNYGESTLDLGNIIISQKEENAAWYIFNWITKSTHELQLMASSKTTDEWHPHLLEIHWSPDKNTEGSCYNHNEGLLYLKDTDGWEPSVFLHEYGHFVMDELYAIYPNTDPNNTNECRNHGPGQNTNSGCAWSEGWATFLAGYLLNDSTPNSSFDLETAYADYWPSYIPPVHIAKYASSSADEGAVAAVLWDIYDVGANENFDNLSNFELVWSILRNQNPNDILQFRDRWYTSNFTDIYYMNIDKIQQYRCGLPDILHSRQITRAENIWPGFTLSTSVSPEGSGIIYAQKDPNCGSTMYKPGTQVGLYAREIIPGQSFKEWSGDASSTSDLINITMDSHKTIVANYETANTDLVVESITYTPVDLEVSENVNFIVRVKNQGTTHAHPFSLHLYLDRPIASSCGEFPGDLIESVTYAGSDYIPAGATIDVEFNYSGFNAPGAHTVAANIVTCGYADPTWEETNINNNSREISLNVKLVSNDSITTPFLINAPSYSKTQSTIGTTTSLGDPMLACGSEDQGYSTVWYQYTPVASGQLVANTLGSDYDTVLAIWTGTSENLTSVGCNDDAQSNTFQSQLQLNVSQGQIYFIEVSGYGAAEYGTLKLNTNSFFTISGNAGSAGATLSYTDGSPKTATANASGDYSFTVPYNWSGMVTPSKTSHTFTPSSKTYNNVAVNKSNENYAATLIVTHTVSGNAGVSGAALNYNDGGFKIATADSNGNYVFIVSNNWSGTVTPSKTGYTFSPANISFSNVTTD